MSKYCNDDEPNNNKEERQKKVDISFFGNGDERDNSYIGIYGEIEEDSASILVANMLDVLSDMMDKEEGEEGEEEKDQPEIKLVVSTPGGDAIEMFSIYDTMRYIKSQGVSIETLGLGKVMSGGVLLLAAGDKGKRKIGKHCRLLIHPAQVEIPYAPLKDTESRLGESKRLFNSYANALANETDLNIKQLKRLMRKDTYFNAETAIKYGIADIII